MFGSNYNKNVGDLVCCVCHVVKVIELVDMSWQHCSHSQQGQDQNLLKLPHIRAEIIYDLTSHSIRAVFP